MTGEEIKDELYRMLSDVLNGNGPIRNNAQRGRYREVIKSAIEAVEQKPKTGHWSHSYGYAVLSPWTDLWLCSECGYKWPLPSRNAKYCPNCGAKMQEGSDKE